MKNTVNAKITSTMLGYEGHGILTCNLNLEFRGSVQSFGGYALDKHNGQSGKLSARFGTAYGCEFIARIMQTVGVDKWEDLKGKYVRLIGQSNSKIEGIGHITDDKTFFPETDLKEFIE